MRRAVAYEVLVLYTKNLIWNNENTFYGGNMPGYLERSDGQIVSVHVSSRMEVPLEELIKGVNIDDMPYRRHLLGGGLVADTSFVPDDIAIPYQAIVGPDTHVVSGLGMSGQVHIWGNLRNPNEVSRVMDDESRKLRLDQKLVSVVTRLLDIERRCASETLAVPLDEALF